jgi:hypothetical protein
MAGLKSSAWVTISAVTACLWVSRRTGGPGLAPDAALAQGVREFTGREFRWD